MKILEGEGRALISGRWFSKEEIEDVKYIVRMFSNLTRSELGKTICECLSWKTPNGRLKVDACQKLLEKLEKESEIELPKKRKVKKSSKKIRFTGETEAKAEITGTVGDISPIELEKVFGSENINLWNEYVHRYHVLGYKRPFGAHQRYFIWSGRQTRQRLGCMLFSASSWALANRDKWIGWSEEDRCQRLHLIVNNSRFLIFPWVRVKNLASKILSLAAQQIRKDWKKRYNYEPVLLETFVDAQLYEGTCYQAANWVYLGQTTGRGRMDRYGEYLSTPKQIYMYPLRSNFRTILCGESGDNQ